jgi:hypothetical protein
VSFSKQNCVGTSCFPHMCCIHRHSQHYIIRLIILGEECPHYLVFFIPLSLHIFRSNSKYRAYVAGCTTGLRFPAGAMMGLFLFATAFRPALGPTQPHIQWVRKLFLPGAKRPGMKLITHLHLVPK